MNAITTPEVGPRPLPRAAGPSADPFREQWASRFAVEQSVLGGTFRFESDSIELLRVVEAAYGRTHMQRLPVAAREFRVALRLVARGAHWNGGAPPPARALSGADIVTAVIDDSNYVVIAPGAGNAVVVASDDMLPCAYHLRCELIELAVFVLASRGMGLVPLHAACIGVDGRGVLLLGDSGAGKSTLALLAMARGFELLAEDAVFVRPDGMLATGVANFAHIRTGGLAVLADAALREWITDAPVIRRRSGIEKFEVDLRGGPARVAKKPLALIGAVILSSERAKDSDALLTPARAARLSNRLDAGQPYAATQPGWHSFKRRLIDSGVHELRRGNSPEDSCAALMRLFGSCAGASGNFRPERRHPPGAGIPAEEEPQH